MNAKRFFKFVFMLALLVTLIGFMGASILASTHDNAARDVTNRVIGPADLLVEAESQIEVTAVSCSRSDVEAAVAQVEVAGGGTVYIPAGDCDWTDTGTLFMPGGISLIGTGQDNTIIRWDSGTLLNINHGGDKSDAMRISGFSFISPGKATAIYMRNIVNFRIDHVYFEVHGKSSYIIAINSRGTAYPDPHGVIDHCSFIAAGEAAEGTYGIDIGAVPWPEGESRIQNLGTDKAHVFVEDSYFEGGGHPIASFNGAHYVFRYNTLKNIGPSIDAHGVGYQYMVENPEQERGGRAIEVYENTLYWEPDQGHNPARIRSGGGVFFNNTVKNSRYPLILVTETSACELTGNTYPCKDQLHEFWIWNNSYEDLQYTFIKKEGPNAEEFIQEDRDYFLRAPSPTLDGFSYTPYTYPHPLVTADLTLHGVPADQTIHLSWTLNGTLPVTSTWQIDYYSQTDNPPSITGVISSTRTYSLYELTNYTFYTVTLNAMLDNTPLLTDTVTVMPTDMFMHLPVVIKEQ